MNTTLTVGNTPQDKWTQKSL